MRRNSLPFAMCNCERRRTKGGQLHWRPREETASGSRLRGPGGPCSANERTAGRGALTLTKAVVTSRTRPIAGCVSMPTPSCQRNARGHRIILFLSLSLCTVYRVCPLDALLLGPVVQSRFIHSVVVLFPFARVRCSCAMPRKTPSLGTSLSLSLSLIN